MKDDEINDLIANAAKLTDSADSSEVLTPLNELYEEIMSSQPLEKAYLDSFDVEDKTNIVEKTESKSRTKFLFTTAAAIGLLALGVTAVLLNNGSTVKSEDFNFAHSPIENSPEATGKVIETDMKRFSSPSGNIKCDVANDNSYCEITNKNWEVKTSDLPKNCDSDVGGIYVEKTGYPKFACVSDVAFPEKNLDVLEYGDSVTTGNITCLSARSGIRCQNTDDKSFVMARDTYPFATGKTKEYEGTFRSPSKNITCVLDKDTPWCIIDKFDWTIKNSDIPKDCDFDFDNNLGIYDGKAQFGCISDLWWDYESTTILKYGDTFTNGEATCLSTRTGMHCEHTNGEKFVMARNTYPLAETSKPVADITPASVDEFVGTFYSPSKNIKCSLDEDGPSCTIDRRFWDPEVKDKFIKDCENDIQGITILDGRAGFYGCISDYQPPIEAERVLEYDDSLTNGANTCTSTREGMLCEHTNGEKFLLSRNTYPLT